MKIAIVGSGVAGIATAHELASDGHKVSVFERRASAAEETSFAPGGLIGAAWAVAFSGPAPRLHGPFSSPGPGVRWKAGLDQTAWGWWRRWRGSGGWAFGSGKHLARLELARLSQARMAELTLALELDHDRSDGLLVLLRDQTEMQAANAPVEALRAAGLEATLIDSSLARAREPALNPDASFHGAIEMKGPAVANCREWALLMRQHAIQAGVHFAMQTPVLAIRASNRGAWEVCTPTSEPEAFDAVVLCTNDPASALLHPLGINLPVMPVQSHSFSAAVREPLDAPQSAVIDLKERVVMMRMGHRVRVTGGGDLLSNDGSTDAASLRRLRRVLAEWFPGAVALSGPKASGQSWCAAMAMTPDDLPLVGVTRLPGLWLNLAHGATGWAVACGAARMIANGMNGRTTTSNDAAFSPQRFGG